MKPKYRIIILVVFLLAFVVTAPSVLLYTAGFRYNWKKSRLEKTGIIKIDSRPAGAQIYLNGLALDEYTPASLFRLLPEEYEVRLVKPGYLPWQKTLEVRSGATAFTEQVALIRDTMPRELYEADIVAGEFSPSGRQLAALARQDDWLEFRLYALPDGGSRLLARFDAAADRRTEIKWSPAGDYLLLVRETAGGGADLALYPTFGDAEAKNLAASRAATDRFAASWSSDGTGIVVTTDRGLTIYDAETGQPTVATLSPYVQDAREEGGKLYVLKTATNGVNLEEIVPGETAPARQIAALPAGQYAFADLAGRRLLVVETRRGEAQLIDTSTGASAGPFNARFGLWEKTGAAGRLLLWGDFEITVYNPDSGERQLVTRLGSPIGRCAWHPGGQAVIYSTEAGVLAVELDSRNRQNAYTLSRLTASGALIVNSGDKEIYLVSTAGRQRGVYAQEL